MSNFEYYLQDIASDISCPNDAIDRSDFIFVKDYVLEILRYESSYFAKICQDDKLFGSVAHNIRLHNDGEYDVLMELRFPLHHRIAQVADKQRPGFVFLDFSDACIDNMIANRLANNQQTFLDRGCLQSWLYGLFKSALNNSGNVVDTGYDVFTLKLWWRNITYTIIAESPSRRFIIDFVPAVKIMRYHSNFNSKFWYAIPRQKARPGNTGNFTFMLSHPEGELQHVQRCGDSMRDALRLLQALRTSKELYKLRCYHMVTAAIWMARSVGHSNVKNMSVQSIFLSLLSDLVDAFNDRHLSFVWDVEMNLLENFSAADMTRYYNVLCCAYNTLSSYPHQPNLSYGRCVAHFK